MVLRPKWRNPRFLLKVLLANVVVFAAAFVIGELALRIWREGGFVAGIESLAAERPAPRGLGTDHWLVHDAELGYTLNPAQQGVSSLRIRHPELVSPKPADAFRLLLIGDSIAWPADGFAAGLAQALRGRQPRVEVINAAVPGYTTHQERLHLARLVGPVAPDLVVLQYCLNDNHRFLHQLTGDGGWLITQEARQALLPEGEGLLARLLRWSYLACEVRVRWFTFSKQLDVGPFAWERDPGLGAAWKNKSWSLVDAELDAMAKLTQDVHARLFVMAVPCGLQLTDAALTKDRSYTLLPQARLAAWCASRAVPLLDLHASCLAHRQERLFTDGLHLSGAGHALVARELASALASAGLLP